jgi:ATP-binding cassette subfamily C (CFTR/MRP) protein 4
MQGCTRLLVTHQRQFLPQCDRVLILRGGSIVADGPYGALRARGFHAELGPEGEAAELDDDAYDQVAPPNVC